MKDDLTIALSRESDRCKTYWLSLGILVGASRRGKLSSRDLAMNIHHAARRFEDLADRLQALASDLVFDSLRASILEEACAKTMTTTSPQAQPL